MKTTLLLGFLLLYTSVFSQVKTPLLILSNYDGIRLVFGLSKKIQRGILNDPCFGEAISKKTNRAF